MHVPWSGNGYLQWKLTLAAYAFWGECHFSCKWKNKSQSYTRLFREPWWGGKGTKGWTSDVPAGPFEVPKEMGLWVEEDINDLAEIKRVKKATKSKTALQKQRGWIMRADGSWVTWQKARWPKSHLRCPGSHGTLKNTQEHLALTGSGSAAVVLVLSIARNSTNVRHRCLWLRAKTGAEFQVWGRTERTPQLKRWDTDRNKVEQVLKQKRCQEHKSSRRCVCVWVWGWGRTLGYFI